MKTLVVLSALLSVASADTLSRCEVANAVRNSQLMNYPYSVADWVCMAYYESGYTTGAIYYEKLSDGQVWSVNCGIFQINSEWWCVDNWYPGRANGCNMNCYELMNPGYTFQTSIDCAAIIVNKLGMEAWTSWVENCKGKSIGHFTADCF